MFFFCFFFFEKESGQHLISFFRLQDEREREGRGRSDTNALHVDVVHGEEKVRVEEVHHADKGLGWIHVKEQHGSHVRHSLCLLIHHFPFHSLFIRKKKRKKEVESGKQTYPMDS